ncbi:hypothetical protein G9A89_020883 [Geosiphon pyriformis]|nr:hypothetical protein G9A89_020883 [Geosiphon pyriformis]
MPEKDPLSVVFISIYHNPTISAVVHFGPFKSLDITILTTILECSNNAPNKAFSGQFRIIFSSLAILHFQHFKRRNDNEIKYADKKFNRLPVNFTLQIYNYFAHQKNRLIESPDHFIEDCPIEWLPISPTPFVGDYHVKGIRMPESTETFNENLTRTRAQLINIDTSSYQNCEC